jgi:hypothetical protein
VRPEQLIRMRVRMHEMVDHLFDGPAREAMVEGWGWPTLRITFESRTDSPSGYTLVVGVDSADPDDGGG